MSDTDFKKPCVFPSPTEQELATLPGPQPGQALRVHVEPGAGGYVRLEQMAHDTGLGWYVQKSFIVPGELLASLLAQLRKADCLIPRPTEAQKWRALPAAGSMNIHDHLEPELKRA